MRDKRTVKIELFSQWKLEGEFRKIKELRQRRMYNLNLKTGKENLGGKEPRGG